MPRNVTIESRGNVPQHVHAITLVRHGRTAFNAQHRLQGQINIPLDEVGEWQVRQTARALRELYVDHRPDIPNRLVVCSDLDRAAATAHAFADPLGLTVHADERVRERSFGDWEGVAVEELAERYPEDYRSWAEFRGGELKYGAESKEHVGKRGVEALNASRNRHRPIRVLPRRLDLTDTADVVGTERSTARFRLHSFDAQRTLGASCTDRNRGHTAMEIARLQSRSGNRRYRTVGTSTPPRP